MSTTDGRPKRNRVLRFSKEIAIEKSRIEGNIVKKLEEVLGKGIANNVLEVRRVLD